MAWNEKRNSGGVAARRTRTPRATPSVSVAPIEVCIATDCRVAGEALLYGLSRFLEFHPVSAVAANPATAAAARADIVLLDAEVSESVSVAVAFRRAHPEARIVITNLSPRDAHISAFIEAGVAGFVLNDASMDDLTGTIRQVFGGMTVLPAALTQSLFSRVRIGKDESHAGGAEERMHFTRRERQVIDLVCAGLQNCAIGKRLNISCHTVRSHVRNVLAKLALHSRHQLAAWARRDRGAEAW